MPATLDAWGGAELTVMVDGADVSCDVIYATVDRSQNRLWDPPDAGVAQITLLIGPDAQDADVGPVGAPVTVDVAYGSVDRTLFTGMVQRRRLEARPELADRITLDCVDGFELLARVNLRAAAAASEVGDGEPVEDRIARWLDEADWPALDRDLAASAYTCPGTQLDGNILRNIQVTALADGGVFFVDGAGVATFLSWEWRTESGSVAAVFSDRKLHDWVPYSAAALHDDLDEVQNSVTGTRREHGMSTPVPQTVENSTSVAAYGLRGDALDDLELEDDTQVSDRVTALVTIAGMPSPRFDAISVQPAADPARMWYRTIPVTYGSLVAANRLWADGTENAYYGHVIGEIWTFTPTDATVTYRVSGTGSWDANGPPRPPIAVEITPGGCIRIPEGLPCNDTDDVIFRDEDGDQVGDTFPPGSLCGEGICDIPEGAVEVCFQNEHGVACIPIDDPRVRAILWVDVLEPGPDIIERVDGDAIDMRGQDYSTNIDEIPGGFDAIINLGASTVRFSDHSNRVAEAIFTDGWTVDFWFYLGTQFGPTSTAVILDLDSIKVQLTTEYQSTGPYVAEFEAVVIDDDDATHLSGPLAQLTDTDDWHHYVIAWTSDGGGTLAMFVDGLEVT